MEVASLSPLPVGALGWNSPDPSYTIIVKATFSIAGDGPASLLPQQLPLSLDEPLAGSDVDLRYGTDFAPLKRGVDVLVVGHARVSFPSCTVPLSIQVDDLRLQGHAYSEAPTCEVPLLERYLRRVVDDPTSAFRLGPSRSSVQGWLSRTVAPGFDFSVFNVAAAEHRLERLPSNARVVLEGLVAGGARRAFHLPAVEPRVFHLPDRRVPQPQAEPVALSCDTLLVDTDRELLTLVWRGAVARGPADASQVAVVALQSAATGISWSEVAPQLPHAHWHRAVQPHDLTSSPRSLIDSDVGLSEREPTLTDMIRVPAADSDGERTLVAPTQRSAVAGLTDGLPFGPPSSKPGVVADDSATPASQLPPPVPATAGHPASVGSQTLAMEDTTAAPSPVPADRSPPPAVADPPAGVGRETLAIDDATELAAALPFMKRAASTDPAAVESSVDDEAAPSTVLASGPVTEPVAGPVTEAVSGPATEPVSPSADQPATARPGMKLGQDAGGTEVVAAVTGQPPLPFHPTSAPQSEAAPTVTHKQRGAETIVSEGGRPAGADDIPFEAPAAPVAPPPHASEQAWKQLGGQTLSSEGLRPSDVLPFRGTAARQAPQRPPAMPVPAAGPAVYPPAPAAPAPADSSPVAARQLAATLSLETYAAIKAELWDGDKQLAQVLDQHGVDEATWLACERQQAKAIAKDASTGSGALAQRIRAAIMEARRQVAHGVDEMMALDDYASLRAALEETSNPGDVLREHDMSAADWDRVQRHFARRAKSDSAFATKLREALAVARRAAAEGS